VYRKSVPTARDSLGSSEETRVPTVGGEDMSGSDEKSSGSMPDRQAKGHRAAGGGGAKGGLHAVAAGLAQKDADAAAASSGMVGIAGNARGIGGLGLN